MPPKKPDHEYEQTALVLQGGGALGAYQAGAYEQLHAHHILPSWFAGISIGSINAAILAGNKPEDRVEKLRAFWEEITDRPLEFPTLFASILPRQNFTALSSMMGASFGIAPFFIPKFQTLWPQVTGTEVPSYYDTSPLYDTLLRYADFDLINSGAVRLSLGAVNIRTGNFVYFDNQNCTLTPKHVMASGALPPGFPPIEIDGEYYWDGGLVSNTPLAYVLNKSEGEDTLVFQVDLFSASGDVPYSFDMVEERRKDIVYSSRTRLNTDAFREKHALRRAISKLAQHIPDNELRAMGLSDCVDLGEMRKVSIVHLIFRPSHYDGPTKDYEFSRKTMTENWQAGADDAHATMQCDAWKMPPSDDEGIAVYDVATRR